jgi:hypothetical protein
MTFCSTALCAAIDMSFLTLEPIGLRPPDAAKYLGISVKMLGRCAAAGWIRPSVKARRCVIYRQTSLVLLFNRLEKEGLPPDPRAAK